MNDAELMRELGIELNPTKSSGFVSANELGIIEISQKQLKAISKKLNENAVNFSQQEIENIMLSNNL
jgi:C4-type Zn-finger protein